MREQLYGKIASLVLVVVTSIVLVTACGGKLNSGSAMNMARSL